MSLDQNNIVHELLWGDHDTQFEFPTTKPLLAHYTSISNFDQIFSNEELWFSNPLNMNDIDELKFGINEGARIFRHSNRLLEACGTSKEFDRLQFFFESHLHSFDENHVLDTYILCLSEHNQDDYDGSLSMWRGYGSNGKGVAFVIDTKKIDPEEKSPLIIAKVHYLSKDEMIEWMDITIEKIEKLIESNTITEELLNAISWHWFERLKIFSLFTKHKGFHEEKEWRIVFLPDRDHDNKFSDMFGCHVSDTGVETKLKLELNKVTEQEPKIKLENLVERIILGPSLSSVLSQKSVERLLELKNKKSMCEIIHASTIPFRHR